MGESEITRVDCVHKSATSAIRKHEEAKEELDERVRRTGAANSSRISTGCGTAVGKDVPRQSSRARSRFPELSCVDA
jgi:hypothetical protein